MKLKSGIPGVREKPSLDLEKAGSLTVGAATIGASLGGPIGAVVGAAAGLVVTAIITRREKSEEK